jgi:hypothetical protein
MKEIKDFIERMKGRLVASERDARADPDSSWYSGYLRSIRSCVHSPEYKALEALVEKENDGWVEWDCKSGNTPDYPSDTLIEVKLRDGTKGIGNLNGWV